MPTWIGTWDGGRIAESVDGPVYHLERMRGGVRYSLSLGVITPKQALAELALFERDPGAYVTAKEAQQEPGKVRGAVLVTADLVIAFAADLRGRGRSERHTRNTLAYLGQWVDELLVGRDLRRVELSEMHDRLDAWGNARPHRVRAIRAFAAFLRRRGLLASADDPTIDLASVQGRTPTPAERSAKTHSVEQLEATYRHLSSQTHRDVFRVRVMTGLHVTEVARLAAGECVLRDVPDGGRIAATVSLVHKSTRAHTQSLGAATAAAARRLMAGRSIGSIRNDDLARAMAAANAARADGVMLEPVRLANLRHTFVTLSARAGTVVHPPSGGVEHAMIAQLVGHSGTRTMGRHYLGDYVPPMIALPIRLEHPDDPPTSPA